MQVSSNVYVGLPFVAPTYYKNVQLVLLFFLFRLPCAAVLFCMMATSIFECDNLITMRCSKLHSGGPSTHGKQVRAHKAGCALYHTALVCIATCFSIRGLYVILQQSKTQPQSIFVLLNQHVFDCAALFTIVRVCGRVDKTVSLDKFTNTYFFCSASL